MKPFHIASLAVNTVISTLSMIVMVETDHAFPPWFITLIAIWWGLSMVSFIADVFKR